MCINLIVTANNNINLTSEIAMTGPSSHKDILSHPKALETDSYTYDKVNYKPSI